MPGPAARPAARGMLSPGQWVALGALSLCAVAAFGIAPDTVVEKVPTRTVLRDLPVPPIAERDDADAVYWREERVQRGDTIGALLARAGVDDAGAMQFLRTDPSARALYQLRPGRPVHVAVDEDGDLVALKFQSGSGELLVVERDGGSFRTQTAPVQEEVRTVLASGEIRTSLFGAADAAGIPDAITTALADVFGGDIDFYHDLQRGDRFTVVYEARYMNGDPAGAGRLLAAEFANKGAVRRVYFYRDRDGNEGYFSETGRNARGAFLKSPMEFSRITSGFTLSRFHPILQEWREHKGVDYAAPVGTPVRVTADGVVTFAGVQSGYGNLVVVKHQGAYSTAYGHLSAFAPKLKAGMPVRQGDTIAFVGQTGWATGPHLHYEFRIADQARDPLAAGMPTAPAIAADQLPRFQAAVTPLAESLALAHSLPGAALAASE